MITTNILLLSRVQVFDFHPNVVLPHKRVFLRFFVWGTPFREIAVPIFSFSKCTSFVI